MLGIGIDFGTSNSSVALFDGKELRYVGLEPSGESCEVMPTALYLDREFQATVGRRAIEAYTFDNAGRTIRLHKEEVGEVVITVAGTDTTQGPQSEGGAITEAVRVHAFTDHDLPGRLFRSLKRWIGNPNVEWVQVPGTRYRIVALVTPILAYIREAAQRAAGETVDWVHVGRPVSFGSTTDANKVALDRLREACIHAGFRNITFYPEPVAASLSFLRERPRQDREVVLAFDFGGGTLDLSVLRTRDERFEILATHGIPLGGDTIDALLYRTKIFPELGEGALVPSEIVTGPRRLPFRFEGFADRLLNWQLAYELNRPELLERIVQGAKEGGETGRKLERLHALVRGNSSYGVFQAIERAKIELSDREGASIEVPELDLSVPLSRPEFETMLEEVLREIEGSVRLVLGSAEVRPSDVGAVVRTGGSSQIPAVKGLLERLFPGRVVGHDTFTSIAGGLAIADFLGYEF